MVALNSRLVLPKNKSSIGGFMQTGQSGFFNFNFKNEQASCFVISLWW